jgi:hypothetical protein
VDALAAGEVDQYEPVARLYHQVSQLDVAINYALGMQSGQGVGRLGHPRQGLLFSGHAFPKQLAGRWRKLHVGHMQGIGPLG